MAMILRCVCHQAAAMIFLQPGVFSIVQVHEEENMSEVQERVQQAIDKLVESGVERGIQVAVLGIGSVPVR